MKKLVYILIAALCTSGLKTSAQNSNEPEVIKHENPVIAEEINPTTVWFVHTWNYEHAGAQRSDKFRTYSTHDDSLVKIVSKEAGIPLDLAKNTYLSGPQKYDYNSYNMSITGKFGLNGTINRKCKGTKYDENTGITADLFSETFPTGCTMVWFFGIVLIVLLSFGLFKTKIVWYDSTYEPTPDAVHQIATVVAPIILPIILLTCSFAGNGGFIGLRDYLYLYNTDDPFSLTFWPGGVLLILCGIIEVALRTRDESPWVKRFIEKTNYVRWSVLAFVFYVIVFHSITHSWSIVGTWFLTAFAVRKIIYLLRRVFGPKQEKVLA